MDSKIAIKGSAINSINTGAQDNRIVRFEPKINVNNYNTSKGIPGLPEISKSDAKDDLEKNSPSVKQSKVIRLEKILNLQDESAALIDDGKDDEAYGMLTKLYELGASYAFVQVLIDYYEVLLKTNRSNKSEAVFNRLVALMKGTVKPTLKECTRLGEKYRSNEEYFKSILFYLIGGELLADITDADRFLSGVQRCALGIKLCVMKMTDDFPYYNEILKLHVIPIMRTMVQRIANVRGKSKKALCLVEVICKHHVEICEGLVGDCNASETTLTESINLLEETLGDEVKKVHLYGTALNNLGATLLRQYKPQEAKHMLLRAIEANMNAEDYSSEEERKQDVQRSESAITQAEDALNNQ